MKLVIAIVQDEDTPALTDALVSAGHRFTKVSTTGSFLRTGNTSLLIGVEDDQVQAVLGILRRMPPPHPGSGTVLARLARSALYAGKLRGRGRWRGRVRDRRRSVRTSLDSRDREPCAAVVGGACSVVRMRGSRSMTGASPVDRVSREEIVALASRLISIPSASGEERAVMEEVIRWCSFVDLPFEVIDSDPTAQTWSFHSAIRPLGRLSS